MNNQKSGGDIAAVYDVGDPVSVYRFTVDSHVAMSEVIPRGMTTFDASSDRVPLRARLNPFPVRLVNSQDTLTAHYRSEYITFVFRSHSNLLPLVIINTAKLANQAQSF